MSAWQHLQSNVVKAGTAYALSGWVIIEVADILVPRLHLPESLVTIIIVLVALGFPFAIIFSWVKGNRTVPVTSTENSNPADDANPLPPDLKSIAVLPFLNLSSDPQQDYFSDGLTDEIITDLSRLQNLLVISRSSMMTFKGTRKKIGEIASEVRARYILEGSVRKAGDSIRITAQLIDASKDVNLWSEKYTGEARDIFEIQEKVSRSIVGALNLKLSFQEDQELSKRPIKNLEAYECFIRARQDMWRFTLPSMENAIILAEQGLSIEKDNALLNALYGTIHLLMYFYGIRNNPSDREIAEVYCRKSLERDPDCSLGHFIEGILVFRSGKIKEANAIFTEALRKDPSNPDLLHWIIVCYSNSGNSDAARPFADKLHQVDPFTPINAALTFAVEFFDARFTEALEVAKEWVRKDSQSPFARFWLALAYAVRGEKDQSVKVLEDMIRDTPHLVFGHFAVFFKLAVQGRAEEARAAVHAELVSGAETHEFMQAYMAWGFALIGDKQGAMRWLEVLYRSGITQYKLVESLPGMHALLRDDSGYQVLIEKMKKESADFLIKP